MATNTFSTRRESSFRMRSKLSYTFNLVMLPQNSSIDVKSVFNLVTHGSKAMSGWIRDTGAVPKERVVELWEYSTDTLLARTVSDPANGGNNYFFNGLKVLDPPYRYVLQVYNEDGSTAARIKDSRVPV